MADLEANSKDLSADLKEFYVVSVKEVDVDAGKKALVIFVPYKLHARFLKISARLVRELEKKFAGKHVVFIAQRNVISKTYARLHPNEKRPRSRTVAAVNDAILNDIVYPTQIVGKRTRVRLDGSRMLKVYVDLTYLIIMSATSMPRMLWPSITKLRLLLPFTRNSPTSLLNSYFPNPSKQV